MAATVHTFTVDMASFRSGMDAVSREFGISLPELFKTHFVKPLLQQLVQLTPPKSLQQGKMSAAVDYGRLYWAVQKPWKHHALLLLAMSRKLPENTDLNLHSSVSKALEWKRRWWKRNGHTSFKAQNHDLGKGFKVRTGQAVLPEFKEQLVKDVGRKVGRLKAGWLSAANALTVNVPAWVRRHAGEGSFSENFTSTGSGYCLITNKVPYIGHHGPNLIRIAFETRRRDLESGFLRKRIQKLMLRLSRIKASKGGGL